MEHPVSSARRSDSQTSFEKLCILSNQTCRSLLFPLLGSVCCEQEHLKQQSDIGQIITGAEVGVPPTAFLDTRMSWVDGRQGRGGELTMSRSIVLHFPSDQPVS
jgi:hypothetical protein